MLARRVDGVEAKLDRLSAKVDRIELLARLVAGIPPYSSGRAWQGAMSWARCGTDSRGRRIGYAYAARCDEPGCRARIDRGLAYACGGTHGAGADFCEGYFCEKHLVFADVAEAIPDGAVQLIGFVCRRCARSYEARHRPRDARGRFRAAEASA
jgi:hypothetical protein